MIERRKFPRVKLSAKSMLCLQDANYKGQLENISLSGALVRLEQSIVVPHGGDYSLSIYIENEDAPLQLIVEVVFSSLSFVGIKFFSCDVTTATRLGKLVEDLTAGAETPDGELSKIRIHLDNYIR